MNLRIFKFLLYLVVTLCFDSGIAIPTVETKNLEVAGFSDKYASPQLYVFGGSDGNCLSSASHFNSSTGDWETTTDMSYARQTPCGAVVGTNVYLFGGTSVDATGQAMILLRTAEVYNCKTGIYSQFRSLPTPRSSCSAAVLNGFIYVAGGFDGSSRLSSVIRYNIQTTQPEKVTPMHIARDALQLVELGGRLYAIGGWNTLSDQKTVEMFHPATNQWKVVASTTFEHKYFGATAHEGGIYVCSNAGCEMYSPVIDKWTTFASPINYHNYVGTKLVSMNHKLWALGGGDRNTKAGSLSVFTYDTFTENWSQQRDMDVPRMYHTAFVVNH